MDNKVYFDKYFKLWWLFIETAFFASKARNKELSKYNITMEQAGILFCVKMLGDNVTSAELGRQRGRERNTISESLSTMVRKGLVKKEGDLRKKNQLRIILTDKGREILEKFDKHLTIQHVFSSLSEDELLLMQKVLFKVHEKALSLNKMDGIQKRPLEFLINAF